MRLKRDDYELTLKEIKSQIIQLELQLYGCKAIELSLEETIKKLPPKKKPKNDTCNPCKVATTIA